MAVMKYIAVFIFLPVQIFGAKIDENVNREKKYFTTDIYVRPKWQSDLMATEKPISFAHKSITSSSNGPSSDESSHRRSNFPKVVDNDWILRNITALWKFMRHIKREVKQLRKQGNWRQGGNMGNRNNIRKNRKKEPTAETKCDKSWFQPHPNVCKSSENATVCGGNGNCICGQCHCKSPYYGEFCQCNDMSCKSFEGELCGGIHHGQCRCGECVCRPKFSGTSCECSTETQQCEKDGIICSNEGSCVCNSCQCTDGFTGSLCQEDIFSASVCENIKPCVLCQAYGINHHKCQNCNLKITTVAEVVGDDKKTCVYFYRGCFLKYSYASLQTEDESMTVYASEKLNCD